ncbi:MAG: ubiquitin-like small modifier protein 2 [Halobacteria archaeon]|nr:ubiquitin-like small modifier protein 2 [Halobacteria archaeon]
MEITAEVMNGDSYEVEVEDDAVYAEILDEVGLNPEGAVVVVEGRPVPEDGRVSEDIEEVKVMRTVSGGRG